MSAPSTTTSKRHSILPGSSSSQPGAPKPPVQFSSSLTIADSALLTGAHTITIRTESVIHPRARLDSTAGRIHIGRRCIVNERSHVGFVHGSSSGSGSSRRPISSSLALPGVSDQADGASTFAGGAAAVTLGDYVTVEVAAVIEAGDTVIGEGSVVGVGSKVGAGAVVGKHCTLTPHTVVAAGEVIPDFTVIYSNGARRADKRGVAELRNKGQTRQIEVLRRMIPSNPARFQ